MSDLHPHTDEADVAEIIARLADLPPHKQQWFMAQLVAMRDGQPNAIEGTAPIAKWSELEGSAHG